MHLPHTGILGAAIAAAGILGLSATPGLAQSSGAYRGFYATGSGGLSFPRDSDLDGPGANLRADLKRGWAAFLGAGYGWGNGFRTEFEAGHHRNGVDSVSGTSASGNMRTWSFMGNVLYDVHLDSPLVPYVGLGIGAARTNFNSISPVGASSINDKDWGFAWQAMAGVGYAVTDRLTATVGYKYFSVPNLTVNNAAGTSIDSEYNTHNVLFGLRYSFAPPPTPVAQPAPPPPQPAPPPPPAVPEVPRNYIVFFDWDSTELSPEALSILRSAADNAKRVAPVRINAIGHADRSGSATYNQGLSERRAAAVKAELVRLGVPENEIGVAGRGEMEPLVSTADGVREPQNRRVEIIFE